MNKLDRTGKHVSEFNNIESYSARFFNSDKANLTSDTTKILLEDPRLCTHCNQTGKQIFIEIGLITGEKSKFDAVALFACSFCKETTLSYLNIQDMWLLDDDKQVAQYHVYTVSEQIPKKRFDIEISEIIQSKYRSFTERFNQSKTAEDNDLNQLAGMGYRKSIEFLVTDFLKDYPTDNTVTSDWLDNPKTTLKNKINKLPTQRLIKTANAIAFIGNDETHYTVRNPDYNIHDMKKFISLLIKEIESELIFGEVEIFLG